MRQMTDREVTESQRRALEPAQFRVQVVLEVWVTATYDDAAAKGGREVQKALRAGAIQGPGVLTPSTVLGRI